MRKPKLSPNGKMMKGLACMSKEKRCGIASMGGLAVAKKKGHMAKIGRAGGLK